MRTVISTGNGEKIPVLENELNVKPLFRSGQPVKNGNGIPLMDDQWIYCNDGRGLHAINVNRAKYCEKIYMSKITIQGSIGENKLMDKDLQKFVEKVSDKLVFEKYGKWYRIFLRKLSNRTYGIAKVVPYRFLYNLNEKFGGQPAHELCIDWRSKFYIR